ncbi:hypothetical protein L914_16672 [Phytophthora nicotianae]|uniref:Uncharacterized protein n=4 Tax=Phytophthora nicotianae TaxID=4792 RepID=V9ECD0_PHYNI|nr:hypothetical protein F443_17318 [Phytophthora nicotianae P1569]ETM36689.1 hypothetical protein L914_16672 [Phytophthora nicotianae]ETO65335.1 hypothetical protein F444_17354 [Phytophthora nicotianae P1976]
MGAGVAAATGIARVVPVVDVARAAPVTAGVARIAVAAGATVAAIAARAVVTTGAIVEETTSMVEPGLKLAVQDALRHRRKARVKVLTDGADVVCGGRASAAVLP